MHISWTPVLECRRRWPISVWLFSEKTRKIIRNTKIRNKQGYFFVENYSRWSLQPVQASLQELHKTNNSNKHSMLRIPNGRRQTSWLFARRTTQTTNRTLKSFGYGNYRKLEKKCIFRQGFWNTLLYQAKTSSSSPVNSYVSIYTHFGLLTSPFRLVHGKNM